MKLLSPASREDSGTTAARYGFWPPEHRAGLEAYMLPDVRRASAFEEVEASERCYILEIANDDADESVSIARARVEPGVTTALHLLRGTVEHYVIVAGLGSVEVDGRGPVEVAAGDVVRIPAEATQRITNHGTKDLIFYCVCTPRFRPECYHALE